MLGRAKEGGVRTLGDFNDDGFATADPVKILMQLQTQLTDMDADGTVLDDTVVLSFAEDNTSNAMLAQILSLAVKSSLGEEKQ